MLSTSEFIGEKTMKTYYFLVTKYEELKEYKLRFLAQVHKQLHHSSTSKAERSNKNL